MSNSSILIRVPSRADYVSMVRLSTSSIGHNIGLNIEEIDDVKVSVGEACINSLSITNDESVTIEYFLTEEKLTIHISGARESIPEDLEEAKERELGVLIIKTLMDEVEFTNDGIIMSKFI